jgi:glycosyltransferase involved in cell wall biosynthesis
MRLLIALTYYRPYTSGLTIYVERLATALAKRGHSITVLTSQYDPSIPLREEVNGVRIVRAPVLARINKGVIMPNIGFLATALAPQHDAMSIHLPQFDAPGISLRGRLLRQPVVLTYHCDLQLAPGLLNRTANIAVDVANNLAGRLATKIVTYTNDYADHSPYLTRFRDKVHVIPPPVELPSVTEQEVADFAAKWNINGPVIGMVTRLAAEKGAEILLDALPKILNAYPNAKVMFAGTHQNVLGEEAYALRLAPLFEKFQNQWIFMGNLSQKELAAFYPNISTLVVPSLNSTESFGLVQVEAMLSGTPSIASSLPGVRQPVIQTGMGEVVPIGDSNSLAEAVIKVLANRSSYIRPRAEIEARYSTERTAIEYEKLFEDLLSQKRK